MSEIRHKINKTLYSTFNMESKSEIIESIYKDLEKATKKEFTRLPESNIGILINILAEKIVDTKLSLLSTISKISSLFDNNKFDGYINPSNSGFKAALLNIREIKDIKLINKENASTQIIVYLKKDYDLKNVNTKIINIIHEYLPIGIDTYKNDNAYITKFKTSTNQIMEYSYFIAKIKLIDIEVLYKLSYEDSNILTQTLIKNIKLIVQNIINHSYGFIGRELTIQDFYTISFFIDSIKEIKLKVDILNEDGNIIETFENSNIPVNESEVIELNNIRVTQYV